MFRLVADARLSAAFLFALWLVNRSACAGSQKGDSFGCGGGGRLGDDLIIQVFSNLQICLFLKRGALTQIGYLKKQLLSGTLFFVREVSQKQR
jgi:hypothetical protein